MKTVSMPLEEYQKELAAAKEAGVKEAYNNLYPKIQELTSGRWAEFPEFYERSGARYLSSYFIENINRTIKEGRFVQSSRDAASNYIPGISK